MLVSLLQADHIVFALDKNPYLELLSGSMIELCLAFRCKKMSHILHIEVQVMCKRID